MNAPHCIPARLVSATLLEDLQLARAALAQRVGGTAPGARAPIGPARAPVELVELVEPRGDGVVERVTPLGYRTARVALPRVLAELPPFDARRAAAVRYLTLHERVGSMPCAGLAAGGSGRVGDGGAVWRIDLARELRAMQRQLGGLALPVVRDTGARGGAQRGERRPVRLRVAVDAVCLDGMGLTAVLRAHGWATSGAAVAALRLAVLDALGRMADQGGAAPGE